MRKNKINPDPFDYSTIRKKLKWFLDLDKFGHNIVTVEDFPNGLFVPEAFYSFCLEHNVDISDAINMVCSDFIVRYHEGNSSYENGILKRIKKLDTDEHTKRKIIKCLLSRSQRGETDGS